MRSRLYLKRACTATMPPEFIDIIYWDVHAGEAIIMLLGNYENFANVVAENIIKIRAFGLNDQCVSFTINFVFIDLEICKNKRKDYKIKVFRFFTKIK